MSQEMLLLIGLCNFIFLFWFIFTLNRIRSSIEEIAHYSRRAALALPLTQGQAKLINRGFTCEELVALVEKHGGKLRVDEWQEDDQTFGKLQIDNRAALDPELVKLLMEQDKKAVKLLWKRAAKIT